MATTVNSAFAEFMRDIVNLDPDVTTLARSSRDWLIEQIHGFEDTTDGFPSLYTQKDIAFGSFARKTKIRELDDIDLMICLSAEGSHYIEYADRLEITVPTSAATLHSFCNDSSDILNSRRIVDKFVSSLKDVPQYEKAEIKRTQEAATLKLKTYTWNFDIVPCFFTTEDAQGNTYYVIPDGLGNWKKTDPRKDRDAVSTSNQQQGGNILDPVRLMKFWNRRPTTPSMSSYLLETIIVTYYLNRSENSASSFVDLEAISLLAHIASAVCSPAYDLKGIQGDLNTLSFEERWKIQQRASLDHSRAVEARSAEAQGDHKASIAKWAEVFGPSFPKYGS